VVSSALRLLGAAFHGMPDLTDMDLPRMTGAAVTYLRAAEPDAAADGSHPLHRILELYASAVETPSDRASSVNLFEFLALLALIRALRQRGAAADVAHAKTLLDSLRTYSTIWGQMLREEPR
jgi:hypothetical protein